VLGVLLAALGLGGVQAPPATAQTPSDPSAAFGGYTAKGRANGVQVTYDLKDVLPLPPPLLQISIPEASATSASGPSATAFGSAAFPGNVIGNLPAIVEQAAPGNGGFIPPFPLQAKADYPAGPPEATQTIGTLSTTVQAAPTGSDAVSTLAATDVPGLVTIGAVTTSAHTGFEDGQVVARSRAEFASIDLLFGLIHLEGVVTDLVATSNGTEAAASGTTSIGAASVLGVPVTIDANGITVGEYAPPTNAGPLTPLIEGLSQLGALGEALATAVDPINALVTQVLGTVNGTLNDALAAAGIHIGVLEPVVNIDGSKASITGNGLVISIVYDGRGDNPLAQLLAALPIDQLPGEGIPGFPLNTSPQALLNLLKETHVVGLAAAYGTAEVVASPSFEAAPPAARPPSSTGATTARPSTGNTSGPTTPTTFSTPRPALATPSAPEAVDTELTGVLGGTAVSAIAVVLALLSSPLWAIGSRRLADAVLAGGAGGCPDGLDRKDL
jgi:hypothetical protein